MAGNDISDRLDRLLVLLERLAAKVENRWLPEANDVIHEEMFRRWAAFRWQRAGLSGRLVPVEHPDLVKLDGLVGIDRVKEELLRNTAQFVNGFPANNVLLWGDRGTGKSSCVKGLISIFANRGLRLIEVQRDDLLSLPLIVNVIRFVPLRFILFCDDLSFAEGDASYQELKTLLEGGIESRPDNMIIYATSNRRHLMPEWMDENRGGEIHPEEAVADKLSLADRFGITLSFYPFSQETYLQIVERHASQRQIKIDDEVRKEAIRWALSKGQRSGRAARQFVDDLAGRRLLEAVGQ